MFPVAGGAGHLREAALLALSSPGEVFHDLFQANPAIENIPKAYSNFSIGERRRIIGTIIATQKGKEWWYFLRHGLTLAALTYMATGAKADLTMDFLKTAFEQAFPLPKLNKVSYLSIAGRSRPLSWLLRMRKTEGLYAHDLQAAIWQACNRDYFAEIAKLVLSIEDKEGRLTYLKELFAGHHKKELRGVVLKVIQRSIEGILEPELKQLRSKITETPIKNNMDIPDISSNDLDTVETKLVYQQVVSMVKDETDQLCLLVYLEGQRTTLSEAFSKYITDCHKAGLNSPEAVKMRIPRLAKRYNL